MSRYVLGLATFLALLPSLRGQPPAPPPAGGLVAPPADARLRQNPEAARDYANARDWAEAIRVLQDLLDGKEDLFLPGNDPPDPDRPAACSRGVRAEAGRLIAGLPPKGLEVYNAVHGAKARALLKEALEKDDL